ncbi:MAG: restriction endonuclease [Alphaproteobacteria bacterium]|nr:MAG: restriction endonuclease [Alphaproteobacteria bacterium]
MWMVRNKGGDNIRAFLDEGIIAIGWRAVGSLKNIKSREQIIKKVEENWPEYKHKKAIVTGSQLNKVANLIRINDKVITYDPSTRKYHLGTVSGEYGYDAATEESMAHFRSVKWEHTIDRDLLSPPTRNSLGSTLTVFSGSDEAQRELESVLDGEPSASKKASEIEDADDEASEQLLLDDLKARAKEFIKDKLIALDWDEMQELVAAVLKAMGYKARISPQGSDRGRDIVASPDGLGLEQPRIVVEVKHRPNSPMGSQDIRSFLGGRHKDDRGLYISTGGFSKDAKYEADRASIPLTLMDIDELVDLVIENYEMMDVDSRSLLPLTKIYWPS